VGNDNFIGLDILVHRALITCYRVVADDQDFVIVAFNGNFFISLFEKAKEKRRFYRLAEDITAYRLFNQEGDGFAGLTVDQYGDYALFSWYTPFAFNFIVLEQFLILMTSLYLSYQFNNYTIYATIIIAYIFHVFGHLIQTIIIRKYVPGLLTGILTSLFTLCNLKNEFPIKLYSYSLFTLLVIILNLVVSFMILHKISHKK